MLNVYFKVVDGATLPIVEKLRALRSRSIRLWFDEEVIKNHQAIRQAKDVKGVQHRQTDAALQYYCWDINVSSAIPLYDGLIHLIHRSLEEGTEFVCIDSVAHCNNQLVLFRDAPHKEELPDCFLKVPCFGSEEAFFAYCAEEHVFSFSLEDTTRFRKCTGIRPIQGASVYQCIATKQYWYKDMLHKTHYEVFDSTGTKHLGEADLEGNLDTSKADKDKKRIL